MMNNIDLLKAYNVDINAALELWGDMESYNESLKEFKESLNSKLASLENFKNTNDLQNYAILAHSMKSESKYLGFMNEAEIFLAHELNGKEGNKEFIDNNFNTIKETVRKMVTLLNSYFNDEENGHKKKILIADDSNIILNYLEKNITEEYKVLKAFDGSEAIELLKNNSIYAILLDLNMPGLDGFEVLKYLKESNLMDKIPVVIITGDDTEETIKKAFSYPILDVLNKPFNDKSVDKIFISIKSFYENKKISV